MLRGSYPEALAALDGVESDAEMALFRAWCQHQTTSKPDGSSKSGALSHNHLITVAARALEANHHLGFAYYVIGRVAEAEGRIDDAARAFRRAAQLSPEHRDARRRDKALKQRRA
ncbi:MAG: tetratricopeptide repeat protein [Myxococcales bacterium]|nr:tetratricopeptide repeat protein [Myxococcales bacterium]